MIDGVIYCITSRWNWGRGIPNYVFFGFHGVKSERIMIEQSDIIFNILKKFLSEFPEPSVNQLTGYRVRHCCRKVGT